MGRMQRDKGRKYEQATARVLKTIWPGAKRGIGQARSAGDCADVEGTPYWVECKHQKKPNIRAAYEQARDASDGRPPVVITKQDKCAPLVTMALTDWLVLFGGKQG